MTAAVSLQLGTCNGCLWQRGPNGERSNRMAARMTEAIWTQGDDPGRMLRYLLRHPPLRPTSRKRALLGAACARLLWAQIDSDQVRRLVECQEKCADDLVWLDQHNALFSEIVTGAGVPRHSASAIVLAG